MTTGRGKQFADGCASESVEGFDRWSHASDEVVHKHSVLG